MSVYKTLGANDVAIKTALIQETEFKFVHLVKFERPSFTSAANAGSEIGLYGSFGEGEASTFGYFTDGNYPESYDDGTKDQAGNFIGPQTYVPSRLLKIGDISESDEIKSNSLNLIFDANSIKTTLTDTATFTSNTITLSNKYWTEEGFAEGDIISFESTGGAGINESVRVRIDKFDTLGKRALITNVSGNQIQADSSALEYKIDLVSDEITTFTGGRFATNFTEYLNRKVCIYRKVYTVPESGIGWEEQGTYTLFEGLIVNGSLNEDTRKNSTMTWKVASQWEAYNVVNGRQTSDDEHRGLINGVSGENSVVLKRDNYARDYGFMHSEKAFNVAARFFTKEYRTRVKKKKKWYGKKKTKRTKYAVWVDAETKVNFNLTSKYIPIVYGVQKVEDPIIAFTDLLNVASGKTAVHSKVFSIHCLCEGPIAKVIDILPDEGSLVCRDEPDFVTRNSNGNPKTCAGRADRGNVMLGTDFLFNTTITTTANGAKTRSKDVVVASNSGLTTGMTLSYVGVSGEPSIVAISGTTITLDIPISVVNGQSLSFIKPLTNYSTNDGGLDTDNANNDLDITHGTTDTNPSESNMRLFNLEGTRIPIPAIHGGVDVSSDGNVDAGNDEIDITAHGFMSTQEVLYLNQGTGSDIGGLISGTTYFVEYVNNNSFKLCTTYQNVLDSNHINISDSDAIVTGTHIFRSVQTGLKHEQATYISHKKELIMFHAGKSNQRANQIFSSIGSRCAVNTTNSTRLKKISGTNLNILLQNKTYKVTSADSALEEQVGATFTPAFINTGGTELYVEDGIACLDQITYDNGLHVSVNIPRKKFTALASSISSNNGIRFRRVRGKYTRDTLRRSSYGGWFGAILMALAASRYEPLYKDLPATATVTNIEDGTPELGFKLQNDYYQNFSLPYWGEDHRLLDTAYIASINRVDSDDNDTDPHDYIVKGKYVDHYNYDNSFLVTSGESNLTNYNIGDFVFVAGGDVQIALSNINAASSGTHNSVTYRVYSKHFSNESHTDAAGNVFTNGTLIYVFNVTANTLATTNTIIAGHCKVEDLWTDGEHVFAVHETFLSVYNISTKLLVNRQVMYSGDRHRGASRNYHQGNHRFAGMIAQSKRLVTNVSGDGTYLYIYSPQHIRSTHQDHFFPDPSYSTVSNRDDVRARYAKGEYSVSPPGMRYGKTQVACIYKFKISKLTAGTKYVMNNSSVDTSQEYYHVGGGINDSFRAKYEAFSEDRTHIIHTYTYDLERDIDDENNDQTLNPYPHKYAIVYPEHVTYQDINNTIAKAIPNVTQTMDKFNNLLHFYFDKTHTFHQENELPKGCTTDGTTLWVSDWSAVIGDIGDIHEDGYYRPGQSNAYRTLLSNCQELRDYIGTTTSYNPTQKFENVNSSLIAGTQDQILIKNFTGSGKIYAYNLSSGARDPAKDIHTNINTLMAEFPEYDKTVSKVENRSRFLGGYIFHSDSVSGGPSSFNYGDKHVSYGSRLHLNNVTNLKRGMQLQFKLDSNDELSATKSYVYGDFMVNTASIDNGRNVTITSISKASEAVVTANAHGYENGDRVILEGISGMDDIDAENTVSLYNTPFTISDKTTNTFKIKDEDGAYIDSSGFSGAGTGGNVRHACPRLNSRTFNGASTYPTIMSIDAGNNIVLLDKWIEMPAVTAGGTEDVTFGYEMTGVNDYGGQDGHGDHFVMNYLGNAQHGYRYRQGFYGTYNWSARGDWKHVSEDNGREFGTKLDQPYDIAYTDLDGTNCMLILNKHREHIARDEIRRDALRDEVLDGNYDTYHGSQGEMTHGSTVFCYDIDARKMRQSAIRVPLGTVGICTHTYTGTVDMGGDGSTANNPTFLYALVEFINSTGRIDYKIYTYLLHFSGNHSEYGSNNQPLNDDWSSGRDIGHVIMAARLLDERMESAGDQNNFARDNRYSSYQQRQYANNPNEYGYQYGNSSTYSLDHLATHADIMTNISASGLSTSTNNLSSVKCHGLAVLPRKTYTNSKGKSMPVLVTTAMDGNGKSRLITNSSVTADRFFHRDGIADGAEQGNMAGLAIVDTTPSGGSPTNKFLVIEKAEAFSTTRPTSAGNPIITSYTDDGDGTLSVFSTHGVSGTFNLGETSGSAANTSVVHTLSCNSSTQTHIHYPSVETNGVLDFEFAPVTESSVALNYTGSFFLDSDSVILVSDDNFHEYNATSTQWSRADASEDLHTSSTAISGVQITDMTVEDAEDGNIRTRIKFNTTFPVGDVDNYTVTTNGTANAMTLDAKNPFPTADSTQVVSPDGETGMAIRTSTADEVLKDQSFSSHSSSSSIGLNLNQDLLTYSSSTEPSRNKFFSIKVREGACSYLPSTVSEETSRVLWESTREVLLTADCAKRYKYLKVDIGGIFFPFFTGDFYLGIFGGAMKVELINSVQDLTVERWNSSDHAFVYRFTPDTEIVEAIIDNSGGYSGATNITYSDDTNKGGASRTYPQVGDQVIYEGMDINEIVHVTAVGQSDNNNTTVTLSKAITIGDNDQIKFLSHQLVLLGCEAHSIVANNISGWLSALTTSTAAGIQMRSTYTTRIQSTGAIPSDSNGKVSFRNPAYSQVAGWGPYGVSYNNYPSVKYEGNILNYEPVYNTLLSDVSNDGIRTTTQYKFPTNSNLDLRATTNPAFHVLDYLISPIYGKGLRLEFANRVDTNAVVVDEVASEIDLDSFLESARLCDAKSQVTVCIKAENAADGADRPLIVGDTYQYYFGGKDPTNVANSSHADHGTRLLFQGVVSEVNTRYVIKDGETETVEKFYEVSFDEVIGHLGKKYTEWEEYTEELVYFRDNVYEIGGKNIVAARYAEADILNSPKCVYNGIRLYKTAEGSGAGTRPTSPVKVDIALNGYTGEFNETLEAVSGTAFEIDAFNEGDIVAGAYVPITINADSGGATTDIFGTITGVDAATNHVNVSFDTSTYSAHKLSVTNSTDIVISNSEIQESRVTPDGNPIVKAYNSTFRNFTKSGYSLYDGDHVKFWRYLGWGEKDQKYVTRHQMNSRLDTGDTLMDNVTSMLAQFNGVLSYSNGSYGLNVLRRQDQDLSGSTTQLAVSTLATSDTSIITEEDIIGKILIDDRGVKNSFNSVEAQIADPQQNFESRQVAFFDSNYLRQDNNKPKKGNYGCPGITNYFNARMNVKQYLDASRFSLAIKFKMVPKGAMLKVGEIISITYDRLSFTNKLFRIKDLTIHIDGLVSVKADEHSDSVYLLKRIPSQNDENVRGTCVPGTDVTVQIPTTLNTEDI